MHTICSSTSVKRILRHLYEVRVLFLIAVEVRTVQFSRGQTGHVVVCGIHIVGQGFRFTQKELQRSPALARLEADGASGAVPLAVRRLASAAVRE